MGLPGNDHTATVQCCTDQHLHLHFNTKHRHTWQQSVLEHRTAGTMVFKSPKLHGTFGTRVFLWLFNDTVW
jgi:hypothetical protein